jgi:predicted TPR repeat methyltransferase
LLNEPIGDSGRNAEVRRLFSEPDRYLSRNPGLFVRAALVRSIVATERPRRILDLGCGDGSISLAFAEQAEHITLVDRSSGMIERARANTPEDALAKVDFVFADISQFSSQRPWDLVLCLGVLAHVESVELVVAKAAESCAPGALCIFQLTDSHHPLAKALRPYNRARYRLRRGRRYETARMSVQDIVESGRRHSLRCRQVRNHMPPLPGTSILPLRWAQRLQLLLSAPGDEAGGRGPEALVVFTKERGVLRV